MQTSPVLTLGDVAGNKTKQNPAFMVLHSSGEDGNEHENEKTYSKIVSSSEGPIKQKKEIQNVTCDRCGCAECLQY